MPDPNIPSQDDLESLRDYLNINQKLSEVVTRHRKQLEDIRKIGGDITNQLKTRQSKEMDLVRKQVEQQKLMVSYSKMLSTVAQENRKELESNISGLKERMDETKQQIETIRELIDMESIAAKEKWERDHKWWNFAKTILNEYSGIQNKFITRWFRINEILSSELYMMGNLSGLLSTVVVLAETALDRFLEWDATAAKFRISMGLTRDVAGELRNIAETTAVNLMNVGVELQQVYASIEALGKEMGGVHNVSRELVKTTALFNAQLGVSVETSAQFLRQMASISGSTMQLQKNTALFASSLAKASGVSLNVVMDDIAHMSGVTLSMISRYPNELLKSAVEARRLNTTISDMARSSRELLNFSQNINDEMEASVLIGRNINLQRARELAYRRDIEGSTKEILRIAKQIDFSNLDVFQMESFAKASGRSVDEILKMLQAEKQINAARLDPSLAKQVAEYDRLKLLSGEMVDQNSKNLELMLLQKANQSRATIISNRWNQILAKSTQLLFPLIDGLLVVTDILLSFLTPISGFYLILKRTGPTVAMISDGFENIISSITKIGVVSKVIDAVLKNSFIAKIGDVIEKGIMGIITMGSKIKSLFSGFKIIEFFSSVASKIGGIFSKFGGLVSKLFTSSKILSFFGMGLKFVPLLGEIITAMQFVYNLWNRLNGIGEAFHEGILNGILFGLKAIAGAIYDTLLKPFVDVWNWVKEKFVGNSPSQLGLGILNGIASVSSMIFDSLTMPFRNAFSWIINKIPGMSKVSDMINQGVSGILNKPKELQISSNLVPVANVNANGITPISTISKDKQDAKSSVNDNENSDENSGLLRNILMELNKLNSNLESGKIAINIDGQLVSSTIARQTSFRGGFGVNKA